MFNQTKVSFHSSWRAFSLLLAPSLFAVAIATVSFDVTIPAFTALLALIAFVLFANAHLAYHAAIRNPANCVITLNGRSMLIDNCGEHQQLFFDEQLWFGVHWGIIRFKTENQAACLIFVSPLTVNSLDESRRLKVHATHNNPLCIRP